MTSGNAGRVAFLYRESIQSHKKLHDKWLIYEKFWNSLIQRMIEIGASDLDDLTIKELPSKENKMNEQSMTVAQTIQEMEKYPVTMKVKIVRLNHTVHGIFQFNDIKVSSKEKELQIAYNNQKTLYQKEEHDLGTLLHQIENVAKGEENKAEVEKFLVCTCEIGSIIPSQVIKDKMYLKHIKSKKEFASGSSMIHYDGVDDTIFLEFMK